MVIRHSLGDRLVLAADRLLRGRRRPGPDGEETASSSRGGDGGAEASDSASGYPAEGIEEGRLDDRARRRSARLMRVNHAGEVAAQALYLGQGMLARDPEVRRALDSAAGEERAHLGLVPPAALRALREAEPAGPLLVGRLVRDRRGGRRGGRRAEPRLRRGDRAPGGRSSRPPSAAPAPRRLPEPRHLPPHAGR